MPLSLQLATPSDAGLLAALHAAVADHLTALHGHGPWSSKTSENGVLYAVRTSRVFVARLEHDQASLPGKTIYVDGQAWTPNWNDKTSTEFAGLNPAFRPRDSQKIQLTKRAGRGTVSIKTFPSADNDRTLSIRIDDNDFGGADWYDILVSW